MRVLLIDKFYVIVKFKKNFVVFLVRKFFLKE